MNETGAMEPRAVRRGTPYAKAVAATSVVFAAVTIVAIVVAVAASRTYAEGQLGAQSQETATGLAKALESAIDDKAATDALVSVMFDRGYFASISVVSGDGRLLAYKELPAAIPGVPAWFPRLAALDAPASEAMVTRHWRQMGRVMVTSHPRFAYVHLWHTAFALVLAISAAYGAMLMVLRRYTRAPAAAARPVVKTTRTQDPPSVERPLSDGTLHAVRIASAARRHQSSNLPWSDVSAARPGALLTRAHDPLSGL